MVDYFYPEGEFECSPGATEVITSLTTGSQPLNVTWRHNGNEVINDSTINSTQFIFLKINDPESEEVFSQLTIRGVGAVAQGTYKIVVRNDAGQDESQEAQLMLGKSSGFPVPLISKLKCNVIQPHSSGTYKYKQSLCLFSASTTAQQSRGRREAPFCNEDPRKGDLIDSHQLVSTDMGPPCTTR